MCAKLSGAISYSDGGGDLPLLAFALSYRIPPSMIASSAAALAAPSLVVLSAAGSPRRATAIVVVGFATSAVVTLRLKHLSASKSSNPSS